MWVGDQAFHNPPLANLGRQQWSHLLVSGLEYSAERIFHMDDKKQQSNFLLRCHSLFKWRQIKSNLLRLRQVKSEVESLGTFL